MIDERQVNSLRVIKNTFCYQQNFRKYFVSHFKIKTFLNDIILIPEYLSSWYHVYNSSFKICIVLYKDNLPLECTVTESGLLSY